ncbi:hypothetical protein ACQKML_21730 [Peribacillus frigoritolerans]
MLKETLPSTLFYRLEEGTYYMIVTIPDDFPENITTLMDKTPETAKLLYTVNSAKNFE